MSFLPRLVARSDLFIPPGNDGLAISPSLRDVASHFDQRGGSNLQFQRRAGVGLFQPAFIFLLLLLRGERAHSFVEPVQVRDARRAADRLGHAPPRLQPLDVDLITAHLRGFNGTQDHSKGSSSTPERTRSLPARPLPRGAGTRL